MVDCTGGHRGQSVAAGRRVVLAAICRHSVVVWTRRPHAWSSVYGTSARTNAEIEPSETSGGVVDIGLQRRDGPGRLRDHDDDDDDQLW